MLNKKKFNNFKDLSLKKQKENRFFSLPLISSREFFQGFDHTVFDNSHINAVMTPSSFKTSSSYSSMDFDRLVFEIFYKPSPKPRLTFLTRSLRFFYLFLLKSNRTFCVVKHIRGGAISASNGFLSFMPKSSIKKTGEKLFSQCKVIRSKKYYGRLSTIFKYNIILSSPRTLKVTNSKKRDFLPRRKKSRIK
jgi:hypothetical protein